MTQPRRVAANHSMLSERASDMLNATEKEFAQTEKKKETQDPKKTKKQTDLRNLIFLGRLEESVTIGGYEFSLQTLNSQQLKQVMLKIMNAPSEEQALVIKPYTLAFSITSVSDTPFSEICDDPFDFVSNLQLSVIDKLWKKYEDMSKRASENSEDDDLKK